MARVLVLGATGYVGRAVARLGARDPDVVLASARGDVAALVDEVRPRAVVNAAGRSEGSPAELRAANVELVARLIDISTAKGLRLVHVGSAAEYGAPDSPLPWDESAPEQPRGEYGRSKLAGTGLIRTAHGAGADVVALRAFNIVGPEVPPNSPIAEFLAMLATRRVVIRNADTVRDYVSASFVASALLVAARAVPAPPQPVVNVCSGTGISMRQLVAALARAAAIDVEILDRGEPLDLPVVIGDPTSLSLIYGLREHMDPDRLAASATPCTATAGSRRASQ